MNTPFLDPGTLSRMHIHCGPFPPNDSYFYWLFFTTERITDLEDRKILFTFNDCPMYLGEKIPDYAPGEYRVPYHQPLPTKPYFFLDENATPDTVSDATHIIAEALAAYVGKEFHGPTAHDRILAKPLR